MIKKAIERLNKLNLESKILILLLFFIILFISSPQTLIPLPTPSIILENIQNWWVAHSSFLLQLTVSSLLILLLLLLLYSFFLFGKIKKTVVAIWDWSSHHLRVLSVLAIGIIEAILLCFYWKDLIDFLRASNESKELPSWIGTILSTLIIAPIAFLIWVFRNTDKTKDLQHAEENIRQTENDIRQTDFHKIQEWATTFPQNKLQAINTETTAEQSATQPDIDSPKYRTEEGYESGILQIAAIYQLLPYVKGEYGERFIRPAMEIYRSLLVSWQWTEAEQQLAENRKSDQIVKPAYIAALHTIFKQEADFFFSSTSAGNSPLAPISGIDLKGVDLLGKNLSYENLSKANLSGANLLSANLHFTNLSEAKLSGANLEGAEFSGTNLRGADLRGAVYFKDALKKAITDETTLC